jgi:hypothetical protein
VILNDRRGRPAATRIGGRATLDELLRRAAQRRPNAIALVDPPNRESFTDGKPRRLTYAQADRMVSAIAGRLRRIGLNTDAVVGIQLANTIESVLTLLGILRAGLIAMPLPLLWRRAEMVAALSRVSASALIVTGRVGTTNHFDLAMNVAAEIFPIRYVCGFGGGAPDGIIPLDDLYAAQRLDPLPSLEAERAGEPGPGAHLAVITWDATAAGLVPVARNHAELIAGGIGVLLESRMTQDAAILSTLTTSSFVGLGVAVVPWLLSTGSLALHQPFDAEAFMTQCKTMNPDTVIVPGPVIGPLAESGHLAADNGLKSLIGVWRAPERLARAPAWRDTRVRMADVQVFGETGLIAACRGPSGKPAVIPFGLVFAPRAPKGTVVVADVAATPAGTVALRGPMVPRVAYPPGVERSGLPYFKAAVSGFVDTGFACHVDSPAMVVTGPPPGIVGIGGYRFGERDLQELVGRAGVGSGALAILPDVLTGHRLAGTASDQEAVGNALAALGANPLLVGAFGDRARPIT